MNETSFPIYDYVTNELTGTYVGCTACSEETYDKDDLFEIYGDKLFDYDWYEDNKSDECFTESYIVQIEQSCEILFPDCYECDNAD